MEEEKIPPVNKDGDTILTTRVDSEVYRIRKLKEKGYSDEEIAMLLSKDAWYQREGMVIEEEK